MSWDSVLRLAVLAADAALATDSTNPDAWLAQAQVNRHIDPADIVLSNRAARRALALDSNLAAAWHELAIGLADSGDLDAAMEHWRRSVVVNPRYTQSLSFIALAHYWRREYDSAAMWVDSSIAVDPTFLLGRSTAGYIEIARGDYSRAGDAFEAARRIGTGIEDLESIAGSALTEASAGHPEASRALLEESEAAAEAYVPPPLHLVVYRAQAYAALRDVRRAISWLSRYQPRRDRHFQLHLRCDPAFDALAGEPAFHALLIRVSC
jgi:tetratricopeptide (TPR) repeat protein